MIAYISVSFGRRKLADEVLMTIADTLNEFNVVPFIFVDHYNFELGQERQMMQQAMLDIDKCDLLIAETSEKGIGIGVEVGYAKAKGKHVIYVRQKDAEHSTTVSGISDFQVIYNEAGDLSGQLVDTLSKVMMSKNEKSGYEK